MFRFTDLDCLICILTLIGNEYIIRLKYVKVLDSYLGLCCIFAIDIKNNEVIVR